MGRPRFYCPFCKKKISQVKAVPVFPDASYSLPINWRCPYCDNLLIFNKAPHWV